MNKFQKSLDRIKSNVPLHEDSWTDEDKEHILTIMEALENQIPKKPKLATISSLGTKWWICLTCGCDDVETNDNFCHDCGQVLDWSDTE